MSTKSVLRSVSSTFVLLFLFAGDVHAQQKPQHDTTYYTTYQRKITTRFYFSKKFAGIKVPSINNGFEYKANTQLNTGFGVTYNNFSLNLAYPLGFFNSDDEKGKTKSIDLEMHVFPYMWAIDVLGILHKGLYTDPKGYGNTSDNYYYRKDATLLIGGVGAYRVPNAEKLSLNAAMIQSEWQKKSAGSLLYGGEVYYGYLKSDGSFIPSIHSNDFRQNGIEKIQFFTIGAGGGYAYTLVVQQHFYVMGSFIANMDVNFTTEHYGLEELKKTALHPSFIYKAAIGYNFSDWNISANFAGNTLWAKTFSADDPYRIPVGNYRFILAKRISTNRK